VALSKAEELLRDARAESRIPDSAAQPTLNDMEAPPLDTLRPPNETMRAAYFTLSAARHSIGAILCPGSDSDSRDQKPGTTFNFPENRPKAETSDAKACDCDARGVT
jgi:hypothetical protein